MDFPNNFEIDFSLKINLLNNLDNIFRSDPNAKEILFLSRYNDYIYKNGYEDLKKYLHSIFKSKKKNIKFSTIHKTSQGHISFSSTLIKMSQYGTI